MRRFESKRQVERWEFVDRVGWLGKSGSERCDLVDGGANDLEYAAAKRGSGAAGWAWASLVAGGMALGWEGMVVLSAMDVMEWPEWLGILFFGHWSVVVGLLFGLPLGAIFCGFTVIGVLWRVRPSRADDQRAGAGMVMGLVAMMCGCVALGIAAQS